MRLNSLNILITAGGQGMGRAAAVACATEGARVIATDVNEAALASLAADHPEIETHLLDVTDAASIQAFSRQMPKLDGLFNCAGYVHNGTLLDVSDEDWSF